MDSDSFLATSFVSFRKTKMGSAGRTPPRIRTKRTASVSSGSSASIASPTSPVLVTPQHFSVSRQRGPPPRLNLAGSSKIHRDDVFMADGEDTALGDLTRVLMLTPRPTQSAFVSPFADSPNADQDAHVRSDNSPLLPPLSEWSLPPVPKHGPLRITPSCDSLLGLSTPSRRGSMHSGRTIHISFPSGAPDEEKPSSLKGEEATVAPASYRTHRPTPSDGSSIISSSSSKRSDWSDRSTPPSIPGRTSSRKRPSLPARISSLKPSTGFPHSRPSSSHTPSCSSSRRPSNASVISAQSVLDPFPIATSAPADAPPLPALPLSPVPTRHFRSSSIASIPLSPVLGSPVDFSAIPFSGLDLVERDLVLRRTTSAPHLRAWRHSQTAMTSSPSSKRIRTLGTPRTPKSARSSGIDFSGSDSPSSPWRASILNFEFFPSPKPSPLAIEHIAEPRDRTSRRSDQEIVIPLYQTPLSPQACVRIRPVPSTSRRGTGLAPDLYAEVKRVDRMRNLIASAGVNEAEEALHEAEEWTWASPPPREGRLVKFVGVGAEEGGESKVGHRRQISAASQLSVGTAFGSDMGLSESHSIDTISEEASVLTPNSSTTFLAVPLPIVADPTTPTATHGFLSPEADITPKAPLRTPSSILKHSAGQSLLDSPKVAGPKTKYFGSLAFGSEPMPRKIQPRSSQPEVRGKEGDDQEAQGREAKGSVIQPGRKAVKVKAKANKEKKEGGKWKWSMPELHPGTIGGLV